MTSFMLTLKDKHMINYQIGDFFVLFFFWVSCVEETQTNSVNILVDQTVNH